MTENWISRFEKLLWIRKPPFFELLPCAVFYPNSEHHQLNLILILFIKKLALTKYPSSTDYI